jgi:hypothetical protein
MAQARVRRVLDVSPLPPARGALKVRPFEECFDRGSAMSPLIMRGELRGSAYWVIIRGRTEIELRGTVGTDHHGCFALVEPQEHGIDGHHALRVEAEAHDVEGSLAAISYLELAGDALARQEIDYAPRWCSVYFNAAGIVDGSSWGGPRSLHPRAQS